MSRDILRFDTQGYFEIARYFARSSFASLSSEPYVEQSILEKITSNFQKRMVEWDMSKEFYLYGLQKLREICKTYEEKL